MSTIRELAAFASGHLAAAAVVAAAALAAVFMLWRAACRVAAAVRTALRGQQAEDVLTVVAAGVATAVAMNGMWRFFGTVLHFSGAERVAMFAFLEIAVVTCAFRARRNMRVFGSAGAEGIAVWVLSGLSAVFSSLDARSGAEALFRLTPPLVAAWLWHRAMSLEHRRSSGHSVHWRVTAERVLVWLRLAEPSARAAGDVDAHRRIARLAREAKHLRELRAADAANWRQRRARRRLDAAMEAAVEHAHLASDPARQDEMRDQLGALNAAEALADLAPVAPWDRRAAEAAEISRIRQEAAAEAQQAAQARIQSAVQEAQRAQADADRITGTVTAQVTALEQVQADLRARAGLAETELVAARRQAAELDEALACAESRAEEIRQEAAALVLAAEQARDESVTEARQAAGIRLQAAGQEAERARADAGRLAEAVTARIAALEQSQADLRARADLAESELAAARRQAAGLDEALARAESRAEERLAEVDRDALVAELAAGIREAAEDSGNWRPDYDDLMERTGRQRRWCEYLVRDARNAVFSPDSQAPAAGSAPEAAHAESRADLPAGHQLAYANGSGP
jgi:hypothetical protein